MSPISTIILRWRGVSKRAFSTEKNAVKLTRRACVCCDWFVASQTLTERAALTANEVLLRKPAYGILRRACVAFS